MKHLLLRYRHWKATRWYKEQARRGTLGMLGSHLDGTFNTRETLQIIKAGKSGLIEEARRKFNLPDFNP